MSPSKNSTKEKIVSYLKLNGQVSGSQLEGQATNWSTKASVISRRARELASEGLIERSMSDRKTVQYRSAQPGPQELFKRERRYI